MKVAKCQFGWKKFITIKYLFKNSNGVDNSF